MSGLDPMVRDDLITTLLSARAENTECIVLSSHQIDDVNRVADEVAIIHAGKLLVHESIDALLASTKRVEAVLLDGRLPEKPLPHTVWQNIERRNWSMTVHPFVETMLDALQADNPISSARIVDLNVEQIFKDMIRGATSPCLVH
jgi:ABC-2 type transport system ATP-binding protein